MNVHVVYCNHETAALDVRERIAFSSEDQFGLAYRRWRSAYPRSELVLLSTCNRVELYAARPDDEETPTRESLIHFLADVHNLPPDQFSSHLLEHQGPEAVRHLFEVACSLDSMVLGEPQIVAQVKEAYERAFRYEACGPLTNALFQMAFRVSGRVRTETALAGGRVSIASVAVGEFGRSIFDRFDDKTVLVIGAGAMAEETVRYLADEGVRDFLVVNRNPRRATELASEWGGHMHPYEQLDEILAQADVVVSATGSDEHIVSAERFRRIRAQSRGQSIFILDLGSPRDFDPVIAGIDDNTFLYDIDDLKATCDANRLRRRKEVEKARKIIDVETERFIQELYHRATGPIVKRLRDEWHAIRQQEVDLLFAKLNHVSESDRQAIEKSIERIVNKLLHPPLEALKDEARRGSPHGLMDALKRLFHLSE